MSTDITDALLELVAASPVALLPDRSPLDPGWKGDGSLQKDLDDVVAHNANLGRHALAVVDLTDDPDPGRTPGFGSQTPAYAGHNDTRQRAIASLAKLLPLYGAYSLRADLAALIPALSISTLDAAGQAIRQNYQRVRAAPAANPNVEHMFGQPAAAGGINFTLTREMTDAEVETWYNSVGIDPNFVNLTVREQLRLLAGWSDNVATTNIIRGLGFDYLWQLARRSGLFRPEWDKLTPNDPDKVGPGGLFVGRDYHGRIWQPPARGGTRPPDAPPPPNQAGTARSIALFLTVLAQDKLVPDYPGNVGMRQLLRKTNSDFTSALPDMEDSIIGAGLAAAGWRASQAAWDEDTTPIPPPTDPKADLAVSKIGADGPNICNGLLVRTTRPDASGVTITAVLVGIDNITGKWDDLEVFGAAMAFKLAARHGVT